MGHEILGETDTVELPDEHIIKIIDPKNQGAQESTKVACTCYSTYHAAEILNEVEHKENITSLPIQGWEIQKKYGTYQEGYGDYLRTALKSVVENNMLAEGAEYPFEGYAIIGRGDNLDFDTIRGWLYRGFPIITSALVTKTNFTKARDTGIWGGNDGVRISGHAFSVIGYTKDCLIALNSYGRWGKMENGTFLIGKENIKYLEGLYVLYDKKDLTEYDKEIQVATEFVVNNGISNGQRLTDPILRQEMFIMLSRFYNLISKNGKS